jgi:hypothetical protein
MEHPPGILHRYLINKILFIRHVSSSPTLSLPPPIGGRVGEGIKQFIFVDNLRILY